MATRFVLCVILMEMFFASCATAQWHFTDVSALSNAAITHSYVLGSFGEPDMMAGGAAGGDLDNDGDIDLVVTRGDAFEPAILVNNGAGFFNLANNSGLNIVGRPNGVLLFDADGDARLDILFGGTHAGDGGNILTPPRLFLNQGNLQFLFYPDSGLNATQDTWSAAAADFNGDGYLDLGLGHWNKLTGSSGHIWKNAGDAVFTDSDLSLGIASHFASVDYSFTPNFADIDNDADLDLLMTGDFSTSRIFRNDNRSAFSLVAQSPNLSDENGMGSALGDVDNDGDLDWFVSSIRDFNGAEGNWGVSGNRLYQNDGLGNFVDVSASAGVRDGGWGWGACMADFNHDGWLDIVQTNGMQGLAMLSDFFADSTRVFVNQGMGVFSDRATFLGLNDQANGRSVVCADFDNDGDIDIFIANRGDPAGTGIGVSKLFRNEGGNAQASLQLRLRQSGPNAFAIGARVYLQTNQGTQIRDIEAGSHFLSSSPSEAHFGLGSASVNNIKIRWPNGAIEWFIPVGAITTSIVRGTGADLFLDGFD